jgi:hypothetical protein
LAGHSFLRNSLGIDFDQWRAKNGISLNNAAFVATRVFQNNRLGVEGGGLVTRDTMFKLTIKRAGIREIEPDI